MNQPEIPWPITPVKRSATSEVSVLIDNELLEDSSGEEYDPMKEDEVEHSDDEGQHGSDVDSQYSVSTMSPFNNSTEHVLECAPVQGTVDTMQQMIQYDNDGIFKLPE